MAGCLLRPRRCFRCRAYHSRRRNHFLLLGPSRYIVAILGMPAAPAADDTLAMVQTVSDVVSELIRRHDRGKAIDVRKICLQCAANHGLHRSPKLVDIIAAIPDSYRKKLQAVVTAKPIRSASGISVVAVMCKPHRCPHIAMTGNICVYCFPEADTRILTDSGFLFLDEIEQRISAGQRVLYACYDTASGALMYGGGTLMFATAPDELITIDSDCAGEGWDELTAPYGLKPADDTEDVEAEEENEAEEDEEDEEERPEGQEEAEEAADAEEEEAANVALAPPSAAMDEDAMDDTAASTARQPRMGRNWRVSLRCTPNHKLFAQRGTAKSWESTRKAVKSGKRASPTEVAPAARAAESMLPCCAACRSLSTRQRKKQLQCSECAQLEKLKWERYRLVAAARVGHAVDPSAQAGRQLVRDALQLHNDEHFRAFLELFGFWIGDGTMQYPGAVLFAEKKDSDRDWVLAQLPLCGLNRTQWTKGGPYSTGQEHVRVTDKRWLTWFDAEYGAKYRTSCTYDPTDERVERAPKVRRLSNEPLMPPLLPLLPLQTPHTPPLLPLLPPQTPQTPETPTETPETPTEDDPDDPIASVKWLPDWVVMQLPPDELLLVVKGLWRADGSWARKDKEIYTSGVRFRDQLMQALLNAGCSPRARLKYKAGTIRGYRYFDQTLDTTTYPVSYIDTLRKQEGWTDEMLDAFTPIRATADNWAVTWSDFTNTQGSSVCWPTLERSRCFTKQAYSAERDKRIWCVDVDHPDALIVAQRAERHNGVVTRQSRPIVVGNCPGGPDSDFEYSTQAYTGYEPTSMRAIRARYDPYKQTRNRVDQLRRLGHDVDKVEFIVMGGTFMSLPATYRDYFIRNLHDALSGHSSSSVTEAIAYSEQSRTKCIGLTIETRPDYCLKPHLSQMLSYGCTRLEVGVQSVYEDVARDTNRGHSVRAVCQSFHLSKDAGFKIIAHMMPDLPNMGMERDVEQFIEYFANPEYRSDGLKLYPTLVIRGTGLYELWKTGRYKNYSPSELIDLLCTILALVPPWTRVYRIQRDIPMPLVTSGVEHGNIRELVLIRMKELGLACRDVRTREVGIMKIHTGIDPDQVELVRRDYTANGGWETFLSYEDAKADMLIGLLRLRQCSDASFRPELQPRDGMGCSVVRELHVYGSAVPVHTRDPTKFQHQGYGTLLMEEAERIAREEHGSWKLAVISGVGTRHYYRKLGYELDGPYMSKVLVQ